MLDQHQQAAFGNTASELDCLRQQNVELHQAVRARDDFIAIAAHELRNPMTPILGIAELALSAAQASGGTCPPRIVALLERMQIAVQAFVKRATGLLDVSRITTGNLKLEPTATSLSEITLSVVQRYEATAARGRSMFDFDIAADVAGQFDRLAVEQVIENLLLNALKFGMGKPVTLRLRLEGQSARLDVQDQGSGMTLDQQKHIFERFEQVMTRHRGGGFGIGLWVANRLVAAMDGKMSVLSTLGAGSTFTVILPLSP